MGVGGATRQTLDDCIDLPKGGTLCGAVVSQARPQSGELIYDGVAVARGVGQGWHRAIKPPAVDAIDRTGAVPVSVTGICASLSPQSASSASMVAIGPTATTAVSLALQLPFTTETESVTSPVPAAEY